MFVRVTKAEVGSQGVDAAVRFFKEKILPQASVYPGWKGSTVLVDRERGTVKTLAYFDNREVIEATDVGASRLRSEFVKGLEGSKILEIEVFEVALQEVAADVAKAA